MLSIELKPHEVMRETPYGPAITKFNQDIVIVNGREAGYVGHHKGAMFLPLSGFPHELQPAVDHFIAEKRGTEVVKSIPSPPVVDPVTGEVVE